MPALIKPAEDTTASKLRKREGGALQGLQMKKEGEEKRVQNVSGPGGDVVAAGAVEVGVERELDAVGARELAHVVRLAAGRAGHWAGCGWGRGVGTCQRERET